MTCICGHHEAVHRAMCGAPEGCGCNKFVPDTPSERVEQAREAYDLAVIRCDSGLSAEYGHQEFVDEAWSRLVAAVRAEERARLRSAVEGVPTMTDFNGMTIPRRAQDYRAAVLSLLSDREGV